MNSPKSLNSLTPDMCAVLCGAVASCECDEAVRAVVVTGTGRAFCAGGDLHTIASLHDDREAAKGYVRCVGKVASAIAHSAKPYIAAVNGVAAGAGFNLAIVCDFVYAASSAAFTQAFSRIGLVSDCCGHFLLPRAVGPRVAKSLMLLPEKLTAADALRLGLVGAVVDDDELERKVMEVAEKLAKQPPLAVKYSKKLLNNLSEFDEIMRQEEEIQAELITSEDCREGIKAFFEKREPMFGGRS